MDLWLIRQYHYIIKTYTYEAGVRKLKEILNENATSQQKAANDRKTKAEDYIKQVKTDLQAQGIINSKDDWKEFEKYAMKHKLSDLYKAAKLWQDVKKAAKQGLKAKAKKKARQKESSKIGTSQKAGQPGKGVSFDEIHGTDWDDIE